MKKPKANKIDDYTLGIIEQLENSEPQKVLNPSQDFIDNNMVYTFMDNIEQFLVFSNRKIIKYGDLESQGYSLRNDNRPSMCNFRAKSAVDYVKGKKVNLIDCFNKISSHMKRYIVFEDERLYSILTLWVIGTYIYRIFRYFPYIWLNADKGSGKTRVMEVISPLAFNSVIAVNHSEASVFRLVDVDGATLLIDEFEKLKKDNQQGIMTLLNSGFNAEANVIRNEKSFDTYRPKTFSAYSPKMFAGIDDISDVLMDRCIKIKIVKKPKVVSIERYKLDGETTENIKQLRDELYICGLQYASDIKNIYDSNSICLPSELSDRECDIWEVLFTMAQFIDSKSGTCIGQTLREYAIESSKERAKVNIEKNDSYKLISVLVDIIPTLKPKRVQEDRKYYDSDEVLEKFKNTEEFGWLKTKNYLTTMLKNKFHIDCDRVTINGKKLRLYCIPDNHLKLLVDRYNLGEVVDISGL